MNKKTILMSPADSKIFNYFEKRFNTIPTDCLLELIPYERYHADMQSIKIKDKLFINKNCKSIISSLDKRNISYTLCDNIGCRYPDNVALNAVLIGNKLMCKESALHPLVKEYCHSASIEIINVKQGYAKCSTLVVNENSIITDDESIYKVALQNDINALLIEKGDIILDDDNYGFIGGASAVIGDSVYFFGDINTHKNANKIKTFIKNRNLNIVSTTHDKLTDIGGIVTID